MKRLIQITLVLGLIFFTPKGADASFAEKNVGSFVGVEHVTISNADQVVESLQKDLARNKLASSQIGNILYYTGQVLDSETGLMNFRNRTYNPTLGRFMQRDPLGYIDSMNMYAYVGNNPINFIDPFGLSKGGSSYQDDLAVLQLIGLEMGEVGKLGGGIGVGGAQGIWGAIAGLGHLASGIAGAITSPFETIDKRATCKISGTREFNLK